MKTIEVTFKWKNKPPEKRLMQILTIEDIERQFLEKKIDKEIIKQLDRSSQRKP